MPLLLPLLLLPLLLLIGWLVLRLRSVNRKLSYFFDSLDNDDFTLRFIEKKGLPSERLLNHSLNRIKNIIQNTRLEIQQKEKYYELILSSINTGIIALNPKGFVTQSNRFALKLLGLDIFTHISQLHKVSSHLQTVFQHIKPGESQRVSYTNERGTVQLLINAASIRIQGEEVRLLVINDIENEMDEKEIDSWIRLIRVLSHEIMNSIAPITSLSDTLLSFYRAPEAEQDRESLKQNTINGLQVISDTGKSLISFVESYRKFTRIPEPVKESIDLQEFIHRMIILCSMEPNFDRITIQTHITPLDLKIYADPNLLGQVILNLMKNAFQAMQAQSQGTLSITAEKELLTNNIRIKISDNGPGIPSEIVNEIFVPFYTTKTEGSGIGLSIARQIMRAHGGNIKVSSLPHHETTFTLTL